MTRRLTYHDIESLKLQVGYGEGPVLIPREAFEELIDNYRVQDAKHLPMKDDK